MQPDLLPDISPEKSAPVVDTSAVVCLKPLQLKEAIVKSLVFLIFASAFLAGCVQTVSQSNRIQPAYAHFYSLTCNQLMERAEILSSKAKLVSSYWSPSRNNVDITTSGRNIDWPKLDDRTGNQSLSSPLKRRLASEMTALETVAKQKHCQFNFKPVRIAQRVAILPPPVRTTSSNDLPPISYSTATIGHDPN